MTEAALVPQAVTIRPATAADIGFLAEAICEAEKGGTACLSYCRIFGLSEAEFIPVLQAMLAEDIDGQELCIAGFLVAEVGGALAGACCAWVEGAAGVSSAILKGCVLADGIDAARMRAAQRHFKLLEQLYLARDEGAIQIESVYVRPTARGRGIAAQLIQAQVARLAPARQRDLVQVILAASNAGAAAVYRGCGFAPQRQSASEDRQLLALVPSLEKLLMQRHLDPATFFQPDPKGIPA